MNERRMNMQNLAHTVEDIAVLISSLSEDKLSEFNDRVLRLILSQSDKQIQSYSDSI
jgi:hypothetical protein